MRKKKRIKLKKCSCTKNERNQMEHLAYPLTIDKNGNTPCPLCGGEYN